MAVEVMVFLAPFDLNSRGAPAKFVVPPHIGESVQIRLGGFADDIIGKVGKVVHTTDLNSGEPVIYVVVERGNL